MDHIEGNSERPITRRGVVRLGATLFAATALPLLAGATGRWAEASERVSSCAGDGEVSNIIRIESASSSASDDKRSASALADASESADVDLAALVRQGDIEVLGSSYATLADALEVANQNGGGTVTLHGDCVSSAEGGKVPTVGFRTSITIESDEGGPYVVYRGEGVADPMLVMTDGTVRVRNVTLDGNGLQVGSPLVIVSDQAVVTFGDGLTLRGNVTDGSAYPKKYGASAVAVMGEDAKLELERGCTIEDNRGVGDRVKAALVVSESTVVNDGAAFEGNSVEGSDAPNLSSDVQIQGEQITNG
jgi:hypothetical protein